MAMSSHPMRGQMRVAKDPNALAAIAAEWFVRTANARPGNLRIALSGGSTPKALYELLGSEPLRARIPWQRIDLFWGDERFVPHDSPESNYRMVRQTLLATVPLPPARIHPVPVDGTPDEAARSYEMALKHSYGADTLDPARPLFDIMLLGLGRDGHTGSLLPGQPVLDQRERWVDAVMSGREEPRVTLTYPAIESSHVLAFLVSGSEKAHVLENVRRGDPRLPAARIRTSGAVIWLVDSAAAGGQP